MIILTKFKVSDCLFILIFSFFLSPPVSSQILIFQHLGIDKGFPANVVYDIDQDQHGDIWLGTDIGLFRYDNQAYLSYSHPSVKDSEIIEVCRADSILFFASLSGNVFYVKKDTVYKLTTDSTFQGINQIIYNSTDKLIYFMALKGLTVYAIEQEEIIAQHLDQEICNGQIVKSDSIPTIYCPYNHEFLKYDLHQKKYVSSIKDNEKTSPIQPYPNCIIGYKSSNKSIVYKNLNNQEPDLSSLNQHLSSFNQIYSLKTDGLNNLWISCDLGLFRVNLDQPAVIEDLSMSVNGHRVNCIFRDREGNYWFGTNGGGVYFWNGNNTLHYNSNNSKLPNNYIYKVYTDPPNTIFVGTKESWLSKIDSTGISNFQLPNTKEAIYDMEKLPNGKILVANTCLYQIDTKLGQISNLSDIFQSCLIKEIYLDDNLQLSYAAGNMFHLNYTENLINITSINNRAYALTHYKDDFIIGSTGGLLTINIANNPKIKHTDKPNSDHEYHISLVRPKKIIYQEFKHHVVQPIEIKNGAVNSSITSLLSLDSTSFWVGTKTHGLYLIKNDSIVYHYHKSNGLNSNVINEISLDEDHKLWIATPNGVNYLSENGKEIASITTNNGLLTNYVNSIAVNAKNIYVGTPIGLSILKEQELTLESQPAGVTVRTVYVNDKPRTLRNSYNLNYKENSIFVKFANASFKQDYNYKYKIGKEKWKIAQNRAFYLQNLSPGKYDLSLKLETLNGNSGPEKHLQIIINYPWWQTKTFFLLTTIFTLLLLRFLYRRQTRILLYRSKRKEETNRKLAELKLQALQAQMNPHFIFNSLNAIQSFVLVGDNTIASEYLGEFSRLMRMFLESSRNRYITLKEEILLLELYVKLEKLRFEDKFQFNFTYDNIDLEQEIPSMLLQPFVENAINHGLLFKKGKGILTIHLFKDNNHLICSIEDNGIGREKAMELKNRTSHSYQSRGMKIIAEKIDVLRIVDHVYASIKITDLFDEKMESIGTRVIIKIPLED